MPNELDRFAHEDLDAAESIRVGNIVRGYLVNVRAENDSLHIALVHERSKRDRLFAECASQYNELKNRRGEVDKSRCEVAAMAKAASRLCLILETNHCMQIYPTPWRRCAQP